MTHDKKVFSIVTCDLVCPQMKEETNKQQQLWALHTPGDTSRSTYRNKRLGSFIDLLFRVKFVKLFEDVCYELPKRLTSGDNLCGRGG